MRYGRRSLGDHGRVIIAMLLTATFMVALAPPVSLRTAAAQEDLAIQTRVQILHASPELGKVEVHINYDEVLDEFEYGDVSDWMDIDPGSNRVTIYEDRAGINFAAFDAVYPVPAGNDYVLVISDALVLTSVVDRSPIVDGGARVRVSHASVDLPAVNVIATGTELSFASQLSYAGSSDYVPVPAGTYDLEVRLADTGQMALTMPGVVLEGNKVYELVIMGAVDNEDKPLEIRTLVDTTNESGADATPTA